MLGREEGVVDEGNGEERRRMSSDIGVDLDLMIVWER